MSFKKEIIKLLGNYSDLMEFNGENKFKINAFRNASNLIRKLDADLEVMIEDGSIENVKGIGKGIRTFLYEFYKNGEVKDYKELLMNVPPGLLELLKIKGMGVKKIKVLHESLGIDSIDKLSKACVENKIAELNGFGAKTQEKIEAEIVRIKKAAGFMLINAAEQIAETVIINISELETVSQICTTGDLRRGVEIASRIEILAAFTSKEEFEKELANIYKYKELSESNLKISFQLKTNFDATIIIHACRTNEFAQILFETTGSKEFLNNFNKLNTGNEYESEEKIFEEFKFPYVIPEMREEIYFQAPENLRQNSELRITNFHGFLHFHTTYSDGVNSLEEMVSAAIDYGYNYFTVCDHSKSAFYANGLSEERILLQKSEIKEVSRNLNVKIFHGIESDILKDGSLDYPDEFMSNFDFVVASVHSIFNLSENDMTNRIIKAIENNNTDVLGHPTGRLLLERDPYKINIEKVIDACVENDVAIEINSNTRRLDLYWKNIYYARERGCKFSINQDAHTIDGIDDLKYGIKVGRKGGLQPEEVINCYNLEKFKHFLKRKVNRELN